MPEAVRTPITGDSTYAEVPSPLSRNGRIATAVEAARGRDRAAAEDFASMFAQLQIDVDNNVATEEMLAQLVDPGADQAWKDYLLQDRFTARQINLGRRFDTAETAWLRSSVVGGDDAPRRVNVELAGGVKTNLQEPGERLFMATRIDVVWKDDQWRVTHFANAIVGPLPVKPGDRVRDALEPGAWRALPRP